MIEITEKFDSIAARIENMLIIQETLEAFLDATPLGILAIDQKGIIVFANKHLEEIVGYSQKELVGLDFHSLLPRRDRKRHKKLEESFWSNPQPRIGNHGLKPVIKTNKGEVDVEISLVPINVHDKSYIYVSVRTVDSIRESIGI